MISLCVSILSMCSRSLIAFVLPCAGVGEDEAFTRTLRDSARGLLSKAMCRS